MLPLLFAGWLTLSQCLLSPTDMQAAESVTTWSETGVTLSGITPIDSPEDFEEYWSGGAGLTLILDTPFQPGYLNAGILLMFHNAQDELIPDFQTRYFFLGWGDFFPLPAGLQGLAGVHCGNCNFIFDDTDINHALKSESEFAVGIDLGCRYDFVHNWSLVCNWKQTTVFTRRRIHMSHLTAGVVYRFVNPDWLRSFLR